MGGNCEALQGVATRWTDSQCLLNCEDPMREDAAMWTLSGFADEIDDDFETQCRVVRELGLGFIEFRSAWGTNVLDLTEEQLAEVQRLLAQYELKVSSIGSPIGKIFIDEPFPAHLERTRHAVEIAQRFEAPFIRVFSFFIREGQDPDAYRDEVISRMRAIADVAAAGGVVLVHENEKDIFGDIPRRCQDIIESVNSPALRATWDPANFVQVGVGRPFDEGWKLLRPYIVYMQIKDALTATQEVVTAGRGDGQVAETIAALHAEGFDGFFSLEPHLGSAHSLGGFSGPELWKSAHRDFTDMLKAQSIPYV